jgi:hypothetical protein
MALKAFRGTPFEHTHENRAFNELFDLLDEHCSISGQDWYLLGNFYVGSRELDAMVIKPNAVIILDFKAFRGKLQFSEDGPWLIEDEEAGSNVQVKGGASVNPLRQLRINKGVMLDFLGRNFTDLNATCNWRHVAALVAFQGPIEFDHRRLPGSIKPWFHISDMRRIVRDLDAIVSREIFLSRENMERLTAQLGIDPFVPAGAPKLNRLSGRETSARDGHRLTQQQSQALGEFSTWLKSGSGVFRLAGMASTGKRFLFPHLVDTLEETNVEMLLLTPSVRISSTYHHPMTQPVSIYTWLYSQQPNLFETKDGRKLGIHEIREDHPLHGKIPVLVDAHLLSDEEFEVGDRRYGSGRLIHDFLSVIAKHKTPFVVIGDPYQMPRGSLQRSLISGNMLEQLGLGVVSHLLTEQILDYGDDALSKLQAHLVDSLDKDRFNKLPRLSGKRLEILENVNSRGWVPDISNVRAESILVCGTHEQAAKVNGAVKTKILGHLSPSKLAAGDRIDFHNRTPILTSEPDALNQSTIRWVSSGEIGLVDFVEERIETHFVELRGRKEPIHLHFQRASCRLPGLGEVEFRYLVDYFEADRPDITADQSLALQVLARRLVKPELEVHKQQLPDETDPCYQQARAEYDRLEYQVLQAHGYLSAALIRPAHALTLHRAQGRRWPSVWVNASRSASSVKPNNADYFRWLYTASVSADEMFTIRQMPFLSPLTNAVVSRAHDIGIGIFPFKHGLFYDASRLPTEQETSMVMPSGFSDMALRPLFLELSERLADSKWSLSDWREHSYQVVITLSYQTAATNIRVRLHYDKKLAVTNVVFLDGNDVEQETIRTLLMKPFKPQSETLAEAVEALQELLAAHRFVIVDGAETSYRVQLTLTVESDAVEIQVNADKEGMISSIRILKASSESIVQQLEKAMAVPS